MRREKGSVVGMWNQPATPVLAQMSACALLSLVLASITGCTTRQLYGGAQAWQRNECQRIQDPELRDRCRKSAAKSFDDYLKEQAGPRSGS